MADADARAALAGEFVRLVLDFRLVAVLLTLIWLRVTSAATPFLTGLVLLVGLISFAALMRWSRIGAFVAAHPAVLAADLVTGLLVLLVLGVDSPFVYVLLGTALLAGALYGYVGAGVFAFLLIACHVTVAIRHGGTARFATLVTLPVLYPAVAFAAAAIGRLIVEYSSAVRQAARVETRTAIARDLHDTLAKTIQGLRFTATALESAATSGNVELARRLAQALRGAAGRAEREARSLMRGWRNGGSERPFPALLDDAVRECAAESGLVVDIECHHDVEQITPAARREVELIIREALRNIAAHARATRAQIRLTNDLASHTLRLSVGDDGIGWPSPTHLSAAAATGHFGMVGIRERISNLGGRIELHSSALGGAGMSIELPLDGERQGPQREVAV